jgi:preprotein translocase subunit YajC
MDVTSLPIVFAQAGLPPNIWVQLFPFAMMLVIFYLLVLMPTRKRQKKVQEFQASLKVGDRVITTGGIYGQVTRVTTRRCRSRSPTRYELRLPARPSAGTRGRSRLSSRTALAGCSS